MARQCGASERTPRGRTSVREGFRHFDVRVLAERVVVQGRDSVEFVAPPELAQLLDDTTAVARQVMYTYFIAPLTRSAAARECSAALQTG